MIELKTFDYDKTTLEVSSNGEAFSIGVLSAMSVESIRASAVFDAQVEAAREGSIELFDIVKVGEIETKTPNKQYNMINAMLSCALVCDWPFEEDMNETLIENQVLANVIQSKAKELAAEFNKKKAS
jgi:hypothetical protein